MADNMKNYYPKEIDNILDKAFAKMKTDVMELVVECDAQRSNYCITNEKLSQQPNIKNVLTCALTCITSIVNDVNSAIDVDDLDTLHAKVMTRLDIFEKELALQNIQLLHHDEGDTIDYSLGRVEISRFRETGAIADDKHVYCDDMMGCIIGNDPTPLREKIVVYKYNPDLAPKVVVQEETNIEELNEKDDLNKEFNVNNDKEEHFEEEKNTDDIDSNDTSNEQVQNATDDMVIDYSNADIDNDVSSNYTDEGKVDKEVDYVDDIQAKEEETHFEDKIEENVDLTDDATLDDVNCDSKDEGNNDILYTDDVVKEEDIDADDLYEELPPAQETVRFKKEELVENNNSPVMEIHVEFVSDDEIKLIHDITLRKKSGEDVLLVAKGACIKLNNKSQELSNETANSGDEIYYGESLISKVHIKGNMLKCIYVNGAFVLTNNEGKHLHTLSLK